jgi:hypothetical protein
MMLADHIAQCETPFLVQSLDSGTVTRLHGAADCAREIRDCPLRFVLSDELVRLCTALAYSSRTAALECADLLHVPSTRVWVEWSQAAWESELADQGFTTPAARAVGSARRGLFLRATPDGRRGTLRAFWSTDEAAVMSASIEGYFDLDTEPGEEPEPPERWQSGGMRVSDRDICVDDVLDRCFRFRYEPSWAAYYAQARLTTREMNLLQRHQLGTVAISIPVMMLFFLLLATRSGLPRREETFERLNRARVRRGKPPLLTHIEVTCPLLHAQGAAEPRSASSARRSPRLHHVRGHLFRRGSELFWRTPHLRGNARAGAIKTRTVRWSFDRPAGLRT